MHKAILDLILLRKATPDLYNAVVGTDKIIDLAIVVLCDVKEWAPFANRIRWQDFDDSYLLYLAAEHPLSWVDIPGLGNELRLRSQSSPIFNYRFRETAYYTTISAISCNIESTWNQIKKICASSLEKIPEMTAYPRLYKGQNTFDHHPLLSFEREDFYLHDDFGATNYPGHPYFNFDSYHNEGNPLPDRIRGQPTPIEFYESKNKLDSNQIPMEFGSLDARVIGNQWIDLDMDRCWDYVKYNLSRLPDKLEINDSNSSWLLPIASYFYRLTGNEKNYNEMLEVLNSLDNQIIYDNDAFRYWCIGDILHRVQEFRDNIFDPVISSNLFSRENLEFPIKDNIKFPYFIKFNTISYRMILELLHSSDRSVVEDALQALIDTESLPYCPDNTLEVYRNHPNPLVAEVIGEKIQGVKDRIPSDFPQLSEVIHENDLQNVCNIPVTNDKKVVEFYLLIHGIGAFEECREEPKEFALLGYIIESPGFNHHIKRECINEIDGADFRSNNPYYFEFDPTALDLGDVLMLCEYRRAAYVWSDPRIPPEILIHKSEQLTEEAKGGHGDCENWDIMTSLLLRNPSLPIRHKNIFNKRLNPLSRRFIYPLRVPR